MKRFYYLIPILALISCLCTVHDTYSYTVVFECYTCHNGSHGAAFNGTSGSDNQTAFSTWHDSHSPTGCLNCHADYITAHDLGLHISTGNKCANCHTDIAPSLMHAIGLHTLLGNGCENCHSDVTKSALHEPHDNATIGCFECHTVIGDLPDPDNCISCHGGRPPLAMLNPDNCTTCHGASPPIMPLNPARCTACHSGSPFNSSVGLDSCSVCHVDEMTVGDPPEVLEAFDCSLINRHENSTHFHPAGSRCLDCHVDISGCPPDNCPGISNPDQADTDIDTIGDACDNCPDNANTSQTDTDNDNIGDACDNCPDNANTSQTDTDNDNIGDACDNCPFDPDNDAADQDGVCADVDNCPATANAEVLGTCVKIVSGVFLSSQKTCIDNGDCEEDELCDTYQLDINNNNIGDACECYADCDNSSQVNVFDLIMLKNEYNRSDCSVNPCNADCNDDENVNIFDLIIMKNQYNKSDCPVIN